MIQLRHMLTLRCSDGLDSRCRDIEDFRQRKVKFDPQAWRVVRDLDASATEAGDRRDEAAAETVAGAVLAAFEAIKSLQNVLALLDRNAGSGAVSALQDCDSDAIPCDRRA